MDFDISPISVHVSSQDDQTEGHRAKIARLVCNCFTRNLQSKLRVLCYLDDRDTWLKEKWGGVSNRGVHWPIRGQGLHEWPQDMWYTIAPVDPVSGTVSWPFASVIYLHGSTCDSDIQLAMTLSHELQHFVQFANDRQLWAIHMLLANLPGLPTHNLRHWFDLPNELEARIVAKLVVERLFGRENVGEHIAMMIAARMSEEDVADWEFVRDIDPDWNYDIRKETIPLVEEYRHELEDLKLKFANDKDLGAVELDLL